MNLRPYMTLHRTSSRRRWVALVALSYSHEVLATQTTPAAEPVGMIPLLQNMAPLIVIGLIVFLIVKSQGRKTKSPGTGYSGQSAISAYQPPADVGDKFCFQCGEVIYGLAEICPECGVRQPIFQTMSARTGTLASGRSKLTAALFALLLGGLGIHKFYLGQSGKGLLYLVFCWTFIPALIGFIEGLMLLSMSEQDFAAKYGA